MVALAQHSKATPSWGTPLWLIEAGERVLGRIDMDLASSAYWNRHGVQAERFFDEHTNALAERDWAAEHVYAMAVWCNPPGGLVREFWRLCRRLHDEQGCSIFWIGFSVEQLSYLQREGLMDPRFRRAIQPKRVAYMQTPADAAAKLLEKAVKAEAKGDFTAADRLRVKAAALPLDGAPMKGEQPTHSSFVLLMPQENEDGQVERFYAEMRQLGAEPF